MSYPHPAFSLTETQAWQLIQQRGFGSLTVIDSQGQFHVAHVPFITAEAPATVECHLAANNPLVSVIGKGTSVLLIVHAGDAYVEPAWYGLGDDQVPTWLYIAAEGHGHIEPMSAGDTARHTDALTAHFEAQSDNPWQAERMNPQRRQRMLDAICGFRLRLRRITGYQKLSQHKPGPAVRSMTQALARRPGHEAIVQALQPFIKQSKET